MHFVIDDCSEKRLSIACTNGDEVPAIGGIIPTGAACRFDAIFVFVEGHQGLKRSGCGMG